MLMELISYYDYMILFLSSGDEGKAQWNLFHNSFLLNETVHTLKLNMRGASNLKFSIHFPNLRVRKVLQLNWGCKTRCCCPSSDISGWSKPCGTCPVFWVDWTSSFPCAAGASDKCLYLAREHLKFQGLKVFFTISPDNVNGHSKAECLTEVRADALGSAPGSPGCVSWRNPFLKLIVPICCKTIA